MKDENPKVSIVIPVFNGSNFLKEAIDSALSQTYDNVEVVVVNDGSNDKGATEKIAKSYGDKIQYFLKTNGGVASALNYGTEKMNGSYFSWLSHDDLYEKTKIEDQIDLIKQYKSENTIVASNASTLYANGIKKKERIDNSTFEFFDIFLATSAAVGVNGCSLLIPKKALIDSGGFDVNLPVTQDYDLWYRLSKSYKFVLLEKPLVISRRHDMQDGVQKQKMCFEAGDQLHYDFLESIEYSRFENYFMDDNNIKHALSNYNLYKISGFKKTASMFLKKILRYYYENDTDKYDDFLNSEIGKFVNLNSLVKEKSKKRIIFFSNVWNLGGIERVISFMFSDFSNKYDCILVTCDDGADNNFGYPLPESVSHIKINNNDQIAELMNLVSILDADLFIGNPNFSESFLDIYTLLKDTKTKSIAYNHGYYFLPYMCDGYLYPTALKVKKSFCDANYVVWLSKIGCNIYNIENSNGLYIPNPTIVDIKRKPKKVINKNILAVGRFDDEIKQIDKILLVFKELHGIDPSYSLDIVGYCPMDMELPSRGNSKLKDFIINQNIPSEKINFLGEQKDVSKFYDKACFLILASRCEGFALVLIESMSRGAPCACFEYLGVEEIVDSGRNGWVCQRDDYLDMANKIFKTVENKQLYLEMSQNSLDSVKKFDLEIFNKSWEKLLSSIFDEIDDKKLVSLKPENKLSISDYNRIIVEYEGLLNIAVKNYLSINTSVVHSRAHSPTIIRAKRLKDSLRRDGIYLTGEKIVRKVNKKLFKK